jgi:hypothetical protein
MSHDDWLQPSKSDEHKPIRAVKILICRVCKVRWPCLIAQLQVIKEAPA